jgi:hypothetical protein
MRTLLLPAIALFGCWTAPKPASTPAKPPEAAGGGGGATGGATYGGAIASLTGTDDSSTGFDSDIYGGLLGTDDGLGPGGYGAGGYGSTSGRVGGGGRRPGRGAAGGGTGVGTLGTGSLGTGGLGSGTAGRRGQLARLPTLNIGQQDPAVTALDAAIIRRYLRRNLQKFQYCYEKELLAKPSISGTVTARFTVDRDGKVTSASCTGLAVVEDCVGDVIRTIDFPRPPDGSAVTVTYPFVFSMGPSTP